MRARPFEDLRQLIPIGHVLEGQRFNRCAGDDETVKFAMFHRVPVLIKTDQDVPGWYSWACVHRP